jgi:hypothetical protein
MSMAQSDSDQNRGMIRIQVLCRIVYKVAAKDCDLHLQIVECLDVCQCEDVKCESVKESWYFERITR